MYLEYKYSCGVVLVFWFWREIVFGVTYVLSVHYSCAVVSVFLLWRESFITTGKKSHSCLSGGLCCCVSFWFWWLRPEKKKFQSSVWRVCQFLILAGNWQFFCCGGKFSLRSEKKSSSRLSGGCVSFWFWQEIGSFFVVAGNFHYDQKKKKFQSSVSFWFWREIGSFLLWR